MSYKQMDNNFSYNDLSLADSMEKNRSLSRMEKINAIINWSSVEHLLLKHYAVGKSAEGISAYPPMLFFNCFLIQQSFRIDSDRELETKINDRIFFNSKVACFRCIHIQDFTVSLILFTCPRPRPLTSQPSSKQRRILASSSSPKQSMMATGRPVILTMVAGSRSR